MRWILTVAAAAVLATAAEAKEKPPKPGSVLHRAAKAHGRPFSLYVPSKYSPRVSWPLVVSSHGLNGSGKGEIGQWIGHAKQHGFIVACPDMCSATEGRETKTGKPKWEEDDEVLLSIFEEIAGLFRINPRAVMITGFSGGGNPSYYSGLRHPDVFTHICTRGGNFASFQIPKEEKLLAAGRKTTDIYIYYGDKDHPLILGKDGKPGQAQQAFDALKAAKYEKVEIEKIANMGHKSRADIAAGWFGEFLKANRKRFLAGDEADALRKNAAEVVGKKRYREGVRILRKCVSIEKKFELEPKGQKALDELNEVARKMLEEAKKAHEGGDAESALKIAGRVARDFRGLTAADEAKALQAEWKP